MVHGARVRHHELLEAEDCSLQEASLYVELGELVPHLRVSGEGFQVGVRGLDRLCDLPTLLRHCNETLERDRVLWLIFQNLLIDLLGLRPLSQTLFLDAFQALHPQGARELSCQLLQAVVPPLCGAQLCSSQKDLLHHCPLLIAQSAAFENAATVHERELWLMDLVNPHELQELCRRRRAPGGSGNHGIVLARLHGAWGARKFGPEKNTALT
mmetsp:Transcript_54407/g.87895  ORF Transcript_54407/g.87895 Transcript_54407/m.87895 type:complete len:212 (+) Transcript_54407:527-1162(+)